MHELSHPKTSYRLVLFALSFWIVGVFLAIFFGFGWFFLLGSIRRSLTYIPPFNRWVRKTLVGEGQPAALEGNPPDPKLVKVSWILGVIITLAWIGLTIVAFAKLNIPLIDIFRSLQLYR